LDDWNSLSEQRAVRQWSWRAELLGGDVVDADQLHTRVRELLRGVGRDVGKVAMKRRRMHPAAQGAPGAKDHPFSAFPIVLRQLSRVYRLDTIRNVDDPRRPDQSIERT